MSLNSSSSIPQPTNKAVSLQEGSAKGPDYAELARFLIQPFLELPNSLSVDCEYSASISKVWIRVAFEGEDKGRVFGRGGRNIQNIRTVITAAAALAGHSVYLDIYGSQNDVSAAEETPNRSATKSTPQRSNSPKPSIKLRSESSS